MREKESCLYIHSGRRFTAQYAFNVDIQIQPEQQIHPSWGVCIVFLLLIVSGLIMLDDAFSISRVRDFAGTQGRQG